MDIENAKKHLSELQEERRKHKISLPQVIKNKNIIIEIENENEKSDKLKKYFIHLLNKPKIQLKLLNENNLTMSTKLSTEYSYNFTYGSLKDTNINISNINSIGINNTNINNINVGIILTGIQTPGGHNIICGILDSLKKKNKKNILYGFLNGFHGITKYDFMELKNEYVSMFRNIGGFDMIRSSINIDIDKKKCFKICRHLNLNGLIIVGDIKFNKKIAELTEYFEDVYSLALEKKKIIKNQNKINEDNKNKINEDNNNKINEDNNNKINEDNKKKINEDNNNKINEDNKNKINENNITNDISDNEIDTYDIVSDLSDEEIKKKYPKKKFKNITNIISIPVSVYGEFKNEEVECSLGFDTTVFSYCHYISYLISHIQTYSKYYHFIKILGNVSSHIALECFLQTKVNVVLIGEEIKEKNKTLNDIVKFLFDFIKNRYLEHNKKYGIILIPEGLLKYVKDFKLLIESIQKIKKKRIDEHADISLKCINNILKDELDTDSYNLYISLIPYFQNQILKEVIKSEKFNYSSVEIEKLLITLVEKKIKNETSINDLKFRNHYYGNECTCSLPTNFDSAYSYILGMSTVEIIEKEYNGYVCVIKNLKHILSDVNKIEIWGIPILNFINLKQKNEKEKISIKVNKVSLESSYFLTYKEYRNYYLYEDRYRILSGIQYIDIPNDSSNIHISKFLNNYLNNEFKSIDFANNTICNKINFIISELKKDFLTQKNKIYKTNTNYERSENMLSEIENLLLKSIIKFNTMLIRNNTRIICITTNFQQKYQFSHIQNINHFYILQQNPIYPPLISSINKCENVGVVLLSDCVPGCNNIIIGLHQRLSIHNFKLFGFIQGIKGLLNNNICLINDNNLKNLNNLGGFPLLGVQMYLNENEININNIEKNENNNIEKNENNNIEKNENNNIEKNENNNIEKNENNNIEKNENNNNEKKIENNNVEKKIENNNVEKNIVENKNNNNIDNENKKTDKCKNNKSDITVSDLIIEEYRDKIIETCKINNIQNLVFIGDEKVLSVMNILNDYFLSNDIKIKIILVPISLYNSFDKNLIECSIGYHSMVCNISDIISNLQTDCLNLNKYYYVIKVHTNICSSLILSVQLQTHCNICIIGESIINQQTNFSTIIENITLIIIERINRIKYYGIILLSSNLIYCIKDFIDLCKDVDDNIKKTEDLEELINNDTVSQRFVGILKKESIELLEICTKSVKNKLLKKDQRENEEIDSNFEIMLINEIKKCIKNLTQKSKENSESYSYKKHMSNLLPQVNLQNIKIYNDINYIQHFNAIIRKIDKEINCVIPTQFDNSLAYSHGLLAGIAVENDLINYVTSIKHLNLNVTNWSSSLYPGYFFVNNDTKDVFKGYPYVAPIPTSVKSSQMATIKHNANTWAYSDSYIYIGSVQHTMNPDHFSNSYIL